MDVNEREWSGRCATPARKATIPSFRALDVCALAGSLTIEPEQPPHFIFVVADPVDAD